MIETESEFLYPHVSGIRGERTESVLDIRLNTGRFRHGTPPMASPVETHEVEVLQRGDDGLVGVCRSAQAVDEEDGGAAFVALLFVEQGAIGGIDRAV